MKSIDKTLPLQRLVSSAVLWLGLSGCPSAEPALRGHILISVDTLRADRLGCYGYDRNTSPFLDSLAKRGVVFEQAYSQLPGTLPSHMSIFTSLYPDQHGVFPPNGILSPTIPTLPEVFQKHGYRTAGHTEGGYMHGRFGFARGFDEFSHEAWNIETDVERTFARGLNFLDSLEGSDRFFLFLHTYAIHDPYPDVRLKHANFRHDQYTSQFWEGDPPDGVDPPTGPILNLLADRGGPFDQGMLDYYQALYDLQIRYFDDVLAGFVSALEGRGLMDEISLVITSDHGEEFGEHGALLHRQAYRESLHIPLILLHPEARPGTSVPTLVESIDIAPTLYELAEIPQPSEITGQSLAEFSRSEVPLAGQKVVYAKSSEGHQLALIHQQPDGSTHHLVTSSLPQEEQGYWVEEELEFDTFEERIALRVNSYSKPRELRVFVDGRPVQNVGLEYEVRSGRLWVSRGVSFDLGHLPELVLESFHRSRTLKLLLDGQPVNAISIRPAKSTKSEQQEYQRIELEQGRFELAVDPVEIRLDPTEIAGRGELTIQAASCESPAELELSDDGRCLAFQLLDWRGLDSPRDVSSKVIIPTEERTLVVKLPNAPGKRRVRFLVDGCDRPSESGASADRRCLSIRIAGIEPAKVELFDSLRDPGQQQDLSQTEVGLARALVTKLEEFRFEPIAPADRQELDSELRERLKSLGYLQ